MWQLLFHENLRFEFRDKAIAYRDKHGLAWSHELVWSGQGFRLLPIPERLNAWQRSHYRD